MFGNMLRKTLTMNTLKAEVDRGLTYVFDKQTKKQQGKDITYFFTHTPKADGA